MRVSQASEARRAASSQPGPLLATAAFAAAPPLRADPPIARLHLLARGVLAADPDVERTPEQRRAAEHGQQQEEASVPGWTAPDARAPPTRPRPRTREAWR